MRERQEAFRDARLIVIASEGKDTERIYFKALAKEYTNPRVHVQTMNSGLSSIRTAGRRRCFLVWLQNVRKMNTCAWL